MGLLNNFNTADFDKITTGTHAQPMDLPGMLDPLGMCAFADAEELQHRLADSYSR